MGVVKKETGVMVSVCCATYNHEKYIEKTLQGFVNQKTDFTFEVLIHDDASTDGTVAIIEKYREQYPEIIKSIYQKENQYSKGIKITPTFQYPRVKGKYIAFCEGDDYWCDEYKLQKQVEVMEKNKACSICVHTVGCMNEKGELLEGVFPNLNLEEGIIEKQKMLYYILTSGVQIFQTSSYFFRSKYLEELLLNFPEFMEASKVGDLPTVLFLITKGNVFYISEKMSLYRKNSDNSWSQQILRQPEYAIKCLDASIVSFSKYNEYTGYKYEELISDYIINLEFSRYMQVQRYQKAQRERYRKVIKRCRLSKRISYIVKMWKTIYIYPLYAKLKGKLIMLEKS